MAEKENASSSHRNSHALAAEHTTAPEKLPLYRQVWDPIGLTPAVIDYPYTGSGTEEDPYIVTWINNDPRNPMGWSPVTRWGIMMVVALCALMVSLCSSAYSGAPGDIMQEFGVSEEVYTLGISLFVLGFAVGCVCFILSREHLGRLEVCPGAEGGLDGRAALFY